MTPLGTMAIRTWGSHWKAKGNSSRRQGVSSRPVRANAAHPRALKHLDELLPRHQAVPEKIPEVFEHLQDRREAVSIAMDLRDNAGGAEGNSG